MKTMFRDIVAVLSLAMWTGVTVVAVAEYAYGDPSRNVWATVAVVVMLALSIAAVVEMVMRGGRGSRK